MCNTYTNRLLFPWWFLVKLTYVDSEAMNNKAIAAGFSLPAKYAGLYTVEGLCAHRSNANNQLTPFDDWFLAFCMRFVSSSVLFISVENRIDCGDIALGIFGNDLLIY